MRGFFQTLAGASVLALAALAPAQAATLDVVRQRGELICGIHGARAGFSMLDSRGEWTGMDVDTCRAIAAAVLGDPSKVRYVRTTAQTRFPILQTGEVDLLANNVTVTLTRDTSMGFNFAPVTFYDAQGFMVPRSLNATSVRDLDGATVCVAPGTTSERVVADVFARNNLRYTPVVIDKQQELAQAFFSGRCDVNVQTTSGLASQRATFASNPDDFVILREVFGRDPMAPAVRHGDEQWRDIVTWVINAMIEAEEMGLTTANLEQALGSEDPAMRRFLGVIPGFGRALGLDERWAYRVIQSVGNYAQVYDRNFGAGSALRLPRGINDLWSRGGLIYAPPFN